MENMDETVDETNAKDRRDPKQRPRLRTLLVPS